MCLVYVADIDAKVRARLNKDGFIYAYKVVNLRYGSSSAEPRSDEKRMYYTKPGLISQFYQFVWKRGWNVSNRPTTNLGYTFEPTQIGCGIHVFLNKKDAIARRAKSYGQVVIRVKCYAEDFVAAGNDNGNLIKSAVFTKVKLEPDEWMKARGVKAKCRA